MAANIRLEDYPQPGLYLLLNDDTRLDLTPDNVERIDTEFWEDQEMFSTELKKSVELQRCDFCPLKKEERFM